MDSDMILNSADDMQPSHLHTREKSVMQPRQHSGERTQEQAPDGGYAACVERSEQNVRDWMTYLPQDCVDSMIRMNWDVTT